MATRTVGLLVFSQGFALSWDEYIIRELAFCDWTGHHQVLFKYLLPTGVSYEQLSETAKPGWIVRPGPCVACRLNRFCQTTIAKTFIPTIR